MSIPREDFYIRMDCLICKTNRIHECEFVEYYTKAHEVVTRCTCCFCCTGQLLAFSTFDYEYLQSELPSLILN